MKRRSMGRNAARTFLVNFGSQMLGLTTSIITARVLGPQARGIFTLVTTLPHTLSAFVKLGLGPGAIYAMRRERVDPSVVASHLLVIAIGLSLPLVVGVVAFREQLAGALLKGADPIYLLLTLPLIPLLLIESYFFAILQGLENFILFNWRVMISSVLAPTSMFVALVVCGGGLAAAILTSLGLIVGMDVWLVITVWRLCGLHLQWDGPFIGRLMKFGIKSHLQTLATHLHMRADVYLVAAFLNPADVAFYSIATRLAELVFHAPEALGMVVYPRQASLGKGRIEDLTAAACRHTMFSTVIGAVALVAVGPWLLRLWYGREYDAAGKPLPFVVLGVVMMSLFFIMTRNFTSQNRQEVNILASGVALALNVGLNVLLIPWMGISGAGLATALSYSLATAILMRLYLRESGKRLRDVLLLQGADVAVYRRLANETLGHWFPNSAAGRTLQG